MCGFYFCNDTVVEYDHNILFKVERFALQLKNGCVEIQHKREKF